MKPPGAISKSRLEAHLRTLCADIGPRLAGSKSERQAAEYIADRGRHAGVQVAIETYPVRERAVVRERLEVRIGNRWQRFPGSLFSNTRGTDGRVVQAPLVFFEGPTEYQRRDLSHLRGKAVVHLGCHIESRQAYRRLLAARPSFLLFVDIRFPGTTALADGMFPSYTSEYGSVPTVNVAFQDAWRWKAEGAAAARLRVDGGMRESKSQNVVLDLPGKAPRAGLLLVGGHHDTQADSPGADDNASGAAGVLELARVLAPLPRHRSIRLISFGAEEQLSVGSAAYVRRHRAELRSRGRVMFNLDSYASHLGWTEFQYNGDPAVGRFFAPFFERERCWVRFRNVTVPYADHFPFAACGVPGGFLYRQNCIGGRFFHHRPDDDLTRVSTSLMASLLEAVARALTRLAQPGPLPFPGRIPRDQAKQIAVLWQDLFGGWQTESTRDEPVRKRIGMKPRITWILILRSGSIREVGN